MTKIRNRSTDEVMCGGLLLKAVLEKHEAWLKDDKEGERANLAGAYLMNANLTDGVKVHGHRFYRAPIQIFDKYEIVLWDGFLKIGCEDHLISDWEKFTNKQIIEMEGKGALEWWKKWKPIIFAMAEATQRGELPEQGEKA